MTQSYRCITFLCCLICFATPLAAQIVNIEDKRQSYDTTGWFGQLDLGVTAIKNNNAVLTIATGGRLDHVRPRTNWLLLANYNVVRAAEQNFVNDGFCHLRNGREITPWLAWETFVQAQYNERTRIRLRALAGAGPRFRLWESERLIGFLGSLYMFEYDELSEGGIHYRDHRLSTYFSVRWKPVSYLSLANTSYYQPILTDLADARLSSVTTITVNLSRRLAFNSRYGITYDDRLSRITTGVPALTYTLVNGLRLTF